MRYVSAYLLATLGGNKAPTAADVKKILSSVGIEADDEKLNIVIKELSGKNLPELIAKGSEKLASVPSGGGGGVAASGAPAAGGGAAAPADSGKKEEKKKEEEEEEEDDDMGFGLFD